MTLDELIEKGWQEHDRDPAGVAASLEAGLDGVSTSRDGARLLRLAVHVIGQELGDWPRAVTLARRVVERSPGEGNDRARLLTDLALCHGFAGDAGAALAAECRALAADPGVALATLLRARLLVAEVMVAARRYPEAIAIYDAVLALAGALGGAGSERTLAVSSNNIASALLEVEVLDPPLEEAMQRAADAARRYWLAAGDWTNDERASYLLALVANRRGRYQAAREHVTHALAVIAGHGGEPVDEAFLHLAMARAEGGLGRKDAQAAALARADVLRPDIVRCDAESWFDREREKAAR